MSSACTHTHRHTRRGCRGAPKLMAQQSEGDSGVKGVVCVVRQGSAQLR